jgi:hypothetical protein
MQQGLDALLSAWAAEPCQDGGFATTGSQGREEHALRACLSLYVPPKKKQTMKVVNFCQDAKHKTVNLHLAVSAMADESEEWEAEMMKELEGLNEREQAEKMQEMQVSR